MKKQSVRPISISVAALGGQGGGVLAQWIVDMAEANGYLAQSTSVAGVAQRTGATIYYLELFPRAEAEAVGKQPVLSQMPVPGDVDICMASELAEAGRSISRGFVSPGLTTLITSSHRVFAIGEKEALGDGRMDSEQVQDAARKAAKKLVMFDMDKASGDTGAVISSILFGALAGSGALPFSREDYEETIRKTGKAVDINLAGFARGFGEADGSYKPEAEPEAPAPGPLTLADTVAELPAPVQHVAQEGVKRLVDYQDRDYAVLYLDRIKGCASVVAAKDPDHKLLTEVARYLALWMGFEDVIRVAALKTKPGRMETIRQEVRAKPDQYFHVVEFFHPRYEEICDTMPAFIGRPMMNSKFLTKWIGRFFTDGRNLTTSKLSGFLPLYFLAGFRRIRRSTLRYKRENEQIESWLEQVKSLAPSDYDLAVEVAQCPRLIKGYGDTHARGYDRFTRIMQAIPDLQAAGDAATKVRALRDAALAAEDVEPFDQAYTGTALGVNPA